MHEMSLAEGILQLVEDTAKRENAHVVQEVVLEIGQLAQVELEALRFCFDVVIRDSVAEGATLSIVTVPGSGWCLPCAQTVALPETLGACPVCGSHQVQVTGGADMRVKEIAIQ
jgi:hydrogenase nickel incorporation protein HypA/HybF